MNVSDRILNKIYLAQQHWEVLRHNVLEVLQSNRLLQLLYIS